MKKLTKEQVKKYAGIMARLRNQLNTYKTSYQKTIRIGKAKISFGLSSDEEAAFQKVDAAFIKSEKNCIEYCLDRNLRKSEANEVYQYVLADAYRRFPEALRYNVRGTANGMLPASVFVKEFGLEFRNELINQPIPIVFGGIDNLYAEESKEKQKAEFRIKLSELE